MGLEVAEIQPTPNPNALKFILTRPVSEQPVSFFSAEAAAHHPLALRLFAVSGVSSLLLLGNFITVNKRPDAKWAEITPAVRRALAEE